MAFQILGLLSRGARSISAAFTTKEQKEVLQGLLQDIVDLRNKLDTLITEYGRHTHGTAGAEHASGTITPTVSGIDVDDTLTIDVVDLTAKQHHATGTITPRAADADDNVVVGATTFVGTVGAVTPGDATYSVDTGDAEAATSLAAQINAHAVASTVVTATVVVDVVHLRAIAAGTDGNAIVLTSTDGTDLAVSGSGTLEGATDPTADEFDISGTDAQCVQSIADAIEANEDLAALVTVETSPTAVTVTAIAFGPEGNDIVLESSDAQIAVSGSGTLTGAGDATATPVTDVAELTTTL